ncbi:hypothetical protein CHS0354_008475 [Potamilus streckersoni]|uniref:Sulfotransferase domain-containing protein n=1 Tax=Potamilus streckersoni TaxID=2493646 RepID=A0AAE0VGG8_9BIVA|nr:hypothetical protein CHS0354_008475 [Potamilus streckersoni]
MLFRKYFKVLNDTVKFALVLVLLFVLLMQVDIQFKSKLQIYFELQHSSKGSVSETVDSKGSNSVTSSSRNGSESQNMAMFRKASPELGNPVFSLRRSLLGQRNGTVENVTQNNESSSTQFIKLNQRKIPNVNFDSVQESPSIVPKRKLQNYKTSSDNGNQPYSCTIPSRENMMMPTEDLFCLKKPNFLQNFKNPCWYADHPYSQQPTLRCLPYFHVFGVCKSGTSDLFLRLLHHPQIVPNRGIMQKETWYWTWKRYGISGIGHTPTQIVTFDDYLDMFDTTRIQQYKETLAGGSTYFPLVTGHGDPMDFWDHSMWRYIPQNNISADEPDVLAPDLIHHVNPDVKLILVLRNPIERLYSHYLHGNYGTTAISFHHDVIQSVQAMQSCLSQHRVRACVYNETLTHDLKVPLSASMYVVHLREWLRVFPRQQIFILRFEDYIQDMERTLRNLFHFLQLDDIPDEQMQRLVSMPRFYKTEKKDYAGAIYRETKEILHRFFYPFTRRLATLLNDSLYTWNDLQLQ